MLARSRYDAPYDHCAACWHGIVPRDDSSVSQPLALLAERPGISLSDNLIERSVR